MAPSAGRGYYSEPQRSSPDGLGKHRKRLVVGLIIIAIRTGFFRKKLGASENLQEYFA